MANEQLPSSINKKFEELDESLTDLQTSLKPFLKIPVTDIREKVKDPLENAKLDLMVAYTANSLFWTYLITQGIDPKTHPIKDELLRIKQYMGKIKLAEEKKTMARVDTSAAKRFVRNALWTPSSEDANSTEKSNADPAPEYKQTNRKDKKDKKRKNEDRNDKDTNNKDKKKKKKKKKE